MTKTNPVTYDGYIEGYYGRLLSFADRKRLLKTAKSPWHDQLFLCPEG